MPLRGERLLRVKPSGERMLQQEKSRGNALRGGQLGAPDAAAQQLTIRRRSRRDPLGRMTIVRAGGARRIVAFGPRGHLLAVIGCKDLLVWMTPTATMIVQR